MMGITLNVTFLILLIEIIYLILDRFLFNDLKLIPL